MIHSNFARVLAERMHEGQKDAHGVPYIYHLYRVVALLASDFASDIVITVGYLHDIIEDTALERDTLTALGFPDEVVEAVGILTRENYTHIEDAELRYDRYIADVLASGNRLAIMVKRADLRDHLFGPRPCPKHLVARYRRALVTVEAALSNWRES